MLFSLAQQSNNGLVFAIILGGILFILLIAFIFLVFRALIRVGGKGRHL
jgi:hypothetical protein